MTRLLGVLLPIVLTALLACSSDDSGGMTSGAGGTAAAPGTGGVGTTGSGGGAGATGGSATGGSATGGGGATQGVTVTITSPESGATFTTADVISLAATATPSPGATFPDPFSDLVWTISGYPSPEGAGYTGSISIDQVGAHTITLTATDSANEVGTASVDVTITQ